MGEDGITISLTLQMSKLRIRKCNDLSKVSRLSNIILSTMPMDCLFNPRLIFETKPHNEYSFRIDSLKQDTAYTMAWISLKNHTEILEKTEQQWQKAKPWLSGIIWGDATDCRGSWGTFKGDENASYLESNGSYSNVM